MQAVQHAINFVSAWYLIIKSKVEVVVPQKPAHPVYTDMHVNKGYYGICTELLIIFLGYPANWFFNPLHPIAAKCASEIWHILVCYTR